MPARWWGRDKSGMEGRLFQRGSSREASARRIFLTPPSVSAKPCSVSAAFFPADLPACGLREPMRQIERHFLVLLDSREGLLRKLLQLSLAG
jgi:hypothetical protein